MEAGPSLPSSRCSPIKVESKLFLCVSSICTHPPGSQEGGGREGFSSNIDNTNLSFTDVVPRSFAAINKKPSYRPNERGRITKFRGRSSYPGKKQNFTVSCLESFRTRLSDEGVSKGASDLIAASGRNGTLRPGKSELAGVCKDRLIYFDTL